MSDVLPESAPLPEIEPPRFIVTVVLTGTKLTANIIANADDVSHLEVIGMLNRVIAELLPTAFQRVTPVQEQLAASPAVTESTPDAPASE